MNIYCDMDGVVADWSAMVETINNRVTCSYSEMPHDEWVRVTQYERFYRDVPLMPQAHELVQLLRGHCYQHNTRFQFLTALPSRHAWQYAAYDKVWWAHHHWPGAPVFFGPYSPDKHKHCEPGDLLIDDNPQNCQQWQTAGGLAVLYTRYENSISQIKEYLK